MNFTNLLRRCPYVSIMGSKPRRQRKPPRNLTAEPLEHRIVLTGELSGSQRLALADGLEAIGNLLGHANSTGKLGTLIPMLDASVGDAVDLGETFKSRLADPIEAWLSTHVDATLGDAIAAMNQTSGLVDGTDWTLTAANASTATETLINVTLAAETAADDVALIFPESVYELIFANLPETTLTANASWSFTLGLGTATNGAFHARFATPLSVTFDVALEDLTLEAQAGLLGLNVGAYGGNESRVGIDADIAIGFVDPNADNRWTLAELQQTPADALAVQTGTGLVDVALFATSGLAIVANDPANPANLTYADDLYDASPEVLQHNFQAQGILPFLEVETSQVVEMFKSLGSLADGISAGKALQAAVPLAKDLSIAQAAKLSEAVQVELVKPLHRPADIAGNPDVIDVFSLQEMLAKLGASMKNMAYDVAARELRFDLVADHVPTTVDADIRIPDAGSLKGVKADATDKTHVASQSKLELSLAIKLDKLGSSLLPMTPATLASALNRGRGVRSTAGAVDVEVALSNGKKFWVDLDSTAATTLGELIGRIQAAADAANGDPANLDPERKKFQLVLDEESGVLVANDRTNGTGEFRFSPLNKSQAFIDLGLYGAGVDAGDVKDRRLEIVGLPLHGDTFADHVTVRGGSIQLDVDAIANQFSGVGTWGAAAVDVTFGSAQAQTTFAATLVPPVAGQPLGKLYELQSSSDKMKALTASASAASQLAVTAPIKPKAGLLSADPGLAQYVFTQTDATRPETILAEFRSSSPETAKQALRAMETLTMADVLDALEEARKYVRTLARQQAAKAALPGIATNLAELFDLSRSLDGVVEGAKANPPKTLQELKTRMSGTSGVHNAQWTIDAVDGKPALRLDLGVTLAEKTSNKATSVDLSVLGANLDAAGMKALERIRDTRSQTPVAVTSKGTIELAIGIERTKGSAARKVFYDDTKVELAVKANKANLSFDTSAGAASARVVSGSLHLDADGEGPSQAPAMYRFAPGTTGSYVELTGTYEETPVESTGQYDSEMTLEILGSLISGQPLDVQIDNLTLPTLASLINGPRVDDLVQAVALQNDLGVLRTGWDDLMSSLDAALDGAVFSQPLPLVGDGLAEGFTALDRMREQVAEELAAIPGTLTPDGVRRALFDAIGPGGFNWITDRNQDGAFTLGDIDVSGNAIQVNFALDLAIPPEVVEADIRLDLLLPGLDLDIDANVDARVGMTIPLRFGVTSAFGIYLLGSPATPWTVSLDATVGDVNNTPAVLGGLLPYRVTDSATNPSGISGSYSIAFNTSAPSGLIGIGDLFSETPSDFIDAGFNGQADVHFAMVTDLPQSAAIPKYRANLDIAWPIGDLAVTNDPAIEFNDFQFELVSFMRDFARPALTEALTLIETMDLVEKIHDEVPVLSTLFGKQSYYNLILFAADDYTDEVGDYVGALKQIRAIVEGESFDTEGVMVDRLTTLFEDAGYEIAGYDLADLANDAGFTPLTDLTGEAWINLGSFVVDANVARGADGDLVESSNFVDFSDEEGLGGSFTSVTGQIAYLFQNPSAAVTSAPGIVGNVDRAALAFLATQVLPGRRNGLLDPFCVPCRAYGVNAPDIDPVEYEVVMDPAVSARLWLGALESDDVLFDYRMPEHLLKLNAAIPTSIVDLILGFASKIGDVVHKIIDKIKKKRSGTGEVDADVDTDSDAEAEPKPSKKERFKAGVKKAAKAVGTKLKKASGFGVSINVKFEVQADLGFSYDTVGLESYRQSRNPADIFNGFYADDYDGIQESRGVLEGDDEPFDDEPEVQFLGGLGVTASLAIPVVASVGFEASILAGPAYNLDDIDGDGKVRASELALNRTVSDINVFDTFGRIDIRADFVASIVGLIDISLNLLTLPFSFEIAKDAVDAPTLATHTTDTGVLQVNIGDRATEQGVTLDTGEDEQVGVYADSAGDIYVSAFGFQSGPFSNVSRIEIDGGAGNDTITVDPSVTVPVLLRGGAGSDVLRGGSGNDTLEGGDGDDVLIGGDGDDDLSGEAGIDQLDGGAGSDVLAGGDGADMLLGGDGNDQLDGGLGDDQLEGGIGDDVLLGDAGNDELSGGIGDDQLDGALGFDTLLGGDGADMLLGGDDDDQIEGGGGADTAHGGAGNDSIFGGVGNDLLYGEEGDDFVNGQGNEDVLYGDLGQDTVVGGGDSDTIYGGEQNDLIFAHLVDAITGGDSLAEHEIDGGSGDDTIYADNFADRIWGREGDDVIHALGGDDFVSAGPHQDIVYGGLGVETIYGGDGDDVVYATHGPGTAEDATNTSAHRIIGGAGRDQIHAHRGNDFLLGDGPADEGLAAVPETDGNDLVYGYEGHDAIDVGGGNDTVFAGAGNDTVFAGVGDDSVTADIGDDDIDAGEGHDYVDAGADQDFVVAGFGNDTVIAGTGHDVVFGGVALGTRGDYTHGVASKFMLPTNYAATEAAYPTGYTPPSIVPVITAGLSIDGAIADGDDSIQGNDGDDILFGGSDGDAIAGGAGRDYIDAGAGNDLTVQGDAGEDVLRGGANDDNLAGGDGIDQLYGDAGDDRLFGDGGDGATLLGQRLFGDAGRDTLYAYAPTGSSGSEALLVGDQLFGGDDGDFMYGNFRQELFVGGNGNDAMFGDFVGGPTYVTYGSAESTGASDTMFGESGEDQLYGGGGDDLMWGGADSDWLEGQYGSDSMFGGSDIDILVLTPVNVGSDSLDGHKGNAVAGDVADDNATDVLLVNGTSGNDTILLGEQAATKRLAVAYNGLLVYATWLDAAGTPLVEQIRIAGLAGNDTLGFMPPAGGVLPAQLSGLLIGGINGLNLAPLEQRSNDFVGMFDGNSGNDVLIGGGGRDRLDGGPGSDTAYGFGGDDRLWGDLGDGFAVDQDVLYGGQGNDDLVGGQGTNKLYAWSYDPALGGEFGVFVDAAGNLFTTSSGGARQKEATGLNRTLGGPNNDELYGGTALDFLYGGGGVDTLYRADGSPFDSLDGGLAGNEWKQYARESDQVWYVGGTNADDQIDVNYVTEPGVLADHHLVTRLTNNNGNFSFAAQVRLDFAAKDASGQLVWDPTDNVIAFNELIAAQSGGDREAELAELDRLETELVDGLLPPEGDFLAIIIDALDGNDVVTVGPTVQKSVWVDAGAGDDRVEFRAGNAILVDQAESSTTSGLRGRNDTAANAYSLSAAAGSSTYTGLSIDNPADVDWFRFTMPAGAAVGSQIRAVGASPIDQLTLSLFAVSDPAATIATGVGQVAASALVAGTTYLLKIVSNATPTIYDLQLDFDADPATLGATTALALRNDALRRDVILGGNGNDVLRGGAGEDWIFGGAGDDVLSGGVDRGASDLLLGEAGNDTFQLIPDALPTLGNQTGSLFDPVTQTFIPTYHDEMLGGTGNDQVLFLGGDRDRNGAVVPDYVALRYNTNLHRYEFASLVWDFVGQKFLSEPSAANRLRQNYLFYHTRDVERTVIDTRAGSDVIHMDSAFKFLPTDGSGNAANFSEWGLDAGDFEQAGSLVKLDIRGGEGDDAIWGGPYADAIDGGAGNDTIVGGRGEDEILGGTGDDQIYGATTTEVDDQYPPALRGAQTTATRVFEFDMATALYVVPPTVFAGVDLSNSVGRDVDLAFALGGASTAQGLGALRSVGDFNADGHDDYLAVGIDRSYLLFGPLKLDAIEDVSTYAEITIDHAALGAPAKSFGDIDGDGFDDLAFVRRDLGDALVTIVLGDATQSAGVFWDRLWSHEFVETKLTSTNSRTIRIPGGTFLTPANEVAVHILPFTRDDVLADVVIAGTSSADALSPVTTRFNLGYLFSGATIAAATTELTHWDRAGKFRTTTGIASLALSAVGDLNGDGRDDLALGINSPSVDIDTVTPPVLTPPNVPNLSINGFHEDLNITVGLVTDKVRVVKYGGAYPSTEGFPNVTTAQDLANQINAKLLDTTLAHHVQASVVAGKVVLTADEGGATVSASARMTASFPGPLGLSDPLVLGGQSWRNYPTQSLVVGGQPIRVYPGLVETMRIQLHTFGSGGDQVTYSLGNITHTSTDTPTTLVAKINTALANLKATPDNGTVRLGDESTITRNQLINSVNPTAILGSDGTLGIAYFRGTSTICGSSQNRRSCLQLAGEDGASTDGVYPSESFDTTFLSGFTFANLAATGAEVQRATVPTAQLAYTPQLSGNLKYRFDIAAATPTARNTYKLGDLNGDGFDEVAITTDTGLGIYYGAATTGTTALPAPTFTITGTNLTATTGDFNGDGRVDLTVGENDVNSRGKVGVFWSIGSRVGSVAVAAADVVLSDVAQKLGYGAPTTQTAGTPSTTVDTSRTVNVVAQNNLSLTANEPANVTLTYENRRFVSAGVYDITRHVKDVQIDVATTDTMATIVGKLNTAIRNSPLNNLVIAEQQTATQLRFRATGFGAYLALTVTERGTGLGKELGASRIDVNEDGVDDLTIGAPGANGEENAVAAGKVYVINGSRGTVALPTTFEILENVSFSGSGSFLVDRATGRPERFVLNAPPVGVEERWYRFSTLGDGAAGDAIWISGGWADLVDSSGRVLLRDAAIVDLRRLEAGTYFLRLDRGDFGPGNVLKPLADNATTASTLQVGALGASIVDVDVRLDIAHANVDDLRIFLTSPAGTRREIVSRAGGSGDNFTGTILDDEAATLVQLTPAPFTGRFRPAQALSAFDGQNPNGTWTLEVQDVAGGNAGTLLAWSLSILTTAGSIEVEAPIRGQDHETTALPDRDTVFGGEGDDLIVTSSDLDHVYGGGGSDRFVAEPVEIRDRDLADEPDGTVAPAEVSYQVLATLDPVVTIPSAGLRAAVAAALGIASTTSVDGTTVHGDFRASQLASLVSLNASNRGINDLSGIELLVNLRSLDLSTNALDATDLAALAPRLLATGPLAGTQVGLRALQVLNLAGNAAINDIASLSGLVNLSELYLSGTGMAAYSQSTEDTLGQLKQLTKLTWPSSLLVGTPDLAFAQGEAASIAVTLGNGAAWTLTPASGTGSGGGGVVPISFTPNVPGVYELQYFDASINRVTIVPVVISNVAPAVVQIPDLNAANGGQGVAEGQSITAGSRSIVGNEVRYTVSVAGTAQATPLAIREPGATDLASVFPQVAVIDPRGIAHDITPQSSLSFDGTDDYVATNLNIDQSSTSAGVTFEAWVKPVNLSPASESPVISTSNGGVDWTISALIGNWHVSNGINIVDTGMAVDNNAWQHIAAVFQPGVGVTFYKNGTPFFSSQIGYDTSDGTVTIGRHFGFPQFIFRGLIDEVRVWSRPLSSAELAVGRLGPIDPATPNLAGYWQLNEGAGAIALDRSASAAHGTLGGGTAAAQPTWSTDVASVFPTGYAPTQNGPHKLAVYVVDGSGGATTYEAPFDVDNVAPAVDLGANRVVSVGATVAFDNPFVADAGADDYFNYRWSVSTTNGDAIAGGYERTFRFVPNYSGVYTVSLTVTDSDGAQTTDQARIDVKPVAVPTLTMPNPVQGEIVTLDGSGSLGLPPADIALTVLPGNAPVRTYQWSGWADNGQVLPVASGPALRFIPERPGRYTIQLFMTDTFGSGPGQVELFDSATLQIDVAAAASPTIVAPFTFAEGTRARFDATASTPDVSPAITTRTFEWNVDERRTRLFASYNNVQLIHELDPITGVSFRSIPTPALQPATGGGGLAFDGRSLFYIRAGGDRALFEVDPDTGAVIDVDPISEPAAPIFAGLAALGGYVYLLNANEEQILEFDPVTDTVRRTMVLPYNLAAGMGELSNPDRLVVGLLGGGVIVVDPASGAVEAQFSTSITAGVTSVGNEIYVGQNGQVSVFSRTGTLLRTFTASPAIQFAGLAASDYAPLTTSTDATFRYTPVDDGDYRVRVTVTDTTVVDGQTYRVARSAQQALGVDNVAPSVSLGADRNVIVGSPVVVTPEIDDPGTADVITYSWNVTASNGQVVAAADNAPLSFVPDAPGNYLVTIIVLDGATNAIDQLTLTAVNALPVANAGADVTVNEGSSVQFTGGFTDAGPGRGTYGYSWDFGDASPEIAGTLDAGQTTMVAHTYADSGVYVARLTITDPHGGVDVDEVVVTVNNLAPANLTLSGDTNSAPLVVTNIHGSFTDLNALLPNGTDLEPVFGSIDFGDGLTLPIAIQRSATTPQATYTFDAQTIYRQPGNYLVQVTVQDDDLGQTVATIPVAIASTTPQQPGDVNGDDRVDLHDVALLQSRFGATGAAVGDADLNDDGVVDRADLAIVAANFGRSGGAGSPRAASAAAAAEALVVRQSTVRQAVDQVHAAVDEMAPAVRAARRRAVARDAAATGGIAGVADRTEKTRSVRRDSLQSGGAISPLAAAEENGVLRVGRRRAVR